MSQDRIEERIDESNDGARPSGGPRIDIVKRAQATGARLGVFASSFNPPTIAHIELIRRAAGAFSLDESLALAGKTNADKLEYECSLADRLAMLKLAFANDEHTSIGLSSHAFYVDMIDALERTYSPQTDLHFIVGFDTFERVLDPGNRYTSRYHAEFSDRVEALAHLLARSSFIVAGRAGAGLESVRALIESEPAVPSERILYLDFPADLGELSATEVRNRRRALQSITGLVPEAVERYIQERGLYTT
jgi:nicotinate (nicotinamide) nucleotide adenylyltransferase